MENPVSKLVSVRWFLKARKILAEDAYEYLRIKRDPVHQVAAPKGMIWVTLIG